MAEDAQRDVQTPPRPPMETGSMRSSSLTRQLSRAPSRQLSRSPSRNVSRSPNRRVSRSPSRQQSRSRMGSRTLSSTDIVERSQLSASQPRFPSRAGGPNAAPSPAVIPRQASWMHNPIAETSPASRPSRSMMLEPSVDGPKFSFTNNSESQVCCCFHCHLYYFGCTTFQLESISIHCISGEEVFLLVAVFSGFFCACIKDV